MKPKKLPKAALDACEASLYSLREMRMVLSDKSWIPQQPEEVLAIMPRTIKDEVCFRVCYRMFTQIRIAIEAGQDEFWLPQRSEIEALLS